MKAIVNDQKMKIIEKLSRLKCAKCGHREARLKQHAQNLDLSDDSDLEILIKGMRAGADLMEKKKKVKGRRERERENSDSDYDMNFNKVTGETRRKKKADKDLYVMDEVTGLAKVDPATGLKIRNPKRHKRKDHYSTGESSFCDEDVYEVDPRTGKFKRDKKTGEIIRKAEADIYEIDARTGRPRIDPRTG